MPSEGPILIGGTGRSGTTLLLRILQRHPSIFAFRWETQFLSAPEGLLNLARRGWKPREMKRFLESLRGRWFHRVIRPKMPNAYEAGLFADLQKGDLEKAVLWLRNQLDRNSGDLIVREFVGRMFDGPLRRSGCRRWCEKTPRNILFVDEFLRIFPDARFIHIVRDGRDVAASMLERGFWPIAAGREFKRLSPFKGPITLHKVALYWKTILEVADEQKVQAGNDRFFEMRFEDLIASPRRNLECLLTFLGEEFTEELMKQDRSRHHIGRWRREFNQSQSELFLSVAGDRLEAEGYL